MNIFLNERLTLTGVDWAPERVEQFDDVIKHLSEILSSLVFHSDVQVYYSSTDIKRLIDNFHLIEAVVAGNYEDKINLLRLLILEINAKDWNKSRIQRTDFLYFHQESLGEKTHNVNETTLAEATEFKHLKNTAAIINLRHSEYNASMPIHVNRSAINPPKTMEMHVLDAFSSKSDLLRYIVSYRTQRKYNHNPKHGENGKGVKANKNEDVSPLECSIVEAEAFLKEAVSIKSKNELYSYDSVRGKFLVYKSESLNVYHGYYPLNQDEVPISVRKFLTE